jgi:exodeoxyribonuclease V gamma subunit
LKFSFDSEDVTSEDDEPFGFDRLQVHQYSNVLLDGLQQHQPAEVNEFLLRQMTTLRGQGKLPLGGFAQSAFTGIAQPAKQAWLHYQTLLAVWPVALKALRIELTFDVANEIQIHLSASLSHLRQTSDGQAVALITSMAQSLVKKDSIQYHHMLLPWLQHLAACADGATAQSYIVGADGAIEIPALTKAEALSHLQILLKAWYQGLQAPLPIACRTAFVWLTEPGKAQAQYEGDDWNRGEVDYDTYLARFFPSFASFYQTEQGNFDFWAEKLYQPVFLNLRASDLQA